MSAPAAGPNERPSPISGEAVVHSAKAARWFPLMTWAVFSVLALNVITGCDRPNRVVSYPDPERLAWRLEGDGLRLGLFTPSGGRWSLVCAGEELVFQGPGLPSSEDGASSLLKIGGVALKGTHVAGFDGGYANSAISADDLKSLSTGGEVRVTSGGKTVAAPRLTGELAARFTQVCERERAASEAKRLVYESEGGWCGELQRDRWKVRPANEPSRWAEIAEIEKNWIRAGCDALPEPQRPPP